jgi:xanthine dehydrogenase iron-sulfur cluster and FAD-binding subunit A
MTKSRDEAREEHKHDPGRRRFLKGVGIAGAGAAIADHLWTEAEAKEKATTPESLSGTVKVVLDVNGQKRDAQVEGLGTPENPNAVQAAFVENDGLMCGFCTPGFVTTISAYLKKNPNPSLAEVREACKGNFCRCGTYPRVFEAALAAAKGSQA